MTERQSVHVILPSTAVLALDLMAMVKTDIGPATWSRAACIREAVEEYIHRRKVSGEPGSYSIRIEDDDVAMRDAVAENPDLFGAGDPMDLPFDEAENAGS